jgi:hypothetical protein
LADTQRDSQTGAEIDLKDLVIGSLASFKEVETEALKSLQISTKTFPV